MDKNLKHQFDILCADFGMNATTAFNIFARTVVREKKIPFEIQASEIYQEPQVCRLSLPCGMRQKRMAFKI
jgi:addiction module RelB/DinJ family antitoxin